MIKFYRNLYQQPRIFGLDILRFFAIFFVLLGHSKILLPPSMDSYVNPLLLDGVAIFFVLSGFLIGGILIKTLQEKQLNGSVLVDFWKRRWLRTIPVYFIVLIFVLIFGLFYKPERIPETWYKYFLFIQNLGTNQPLFFSESWSLSIEEWFYLISPILLALFIFATKNLKRSLVLVIVLVIIAVIILRYYLYYSHDFQDFLSVDFTVMRRVFSRLDALMIGVFAAFIKVYYPARWNNLTHVIFLVIGALGLYAIKYFNEDALDAQTIVWSPFLKSIAVFMMLPYLSTVKKPRYSWMHVFTHLSLISYSMYLINRTIVIDILIKFGIFGVLRSNYVIPENWWFYYLLFWLFTIAISSLMYQWIEVPFLKLRNWKRVKGE